MSDPPVSRGRMWCRFVAGMAWLAVIAGLLAQVNGYPFAAMYAATVGTGLLTSGLALVWLFRWATNEQARARQFAVSSLFFLTTFIAMYLAAVRWVVVETEAHVRQQLPWLAMILVALVVAVFALVTCPFVLWVTEALLWFAVWLVRWPPARPLWKRLMRWSSLVAHTNKRSTGKRRW